MPLDKIVGLLDGLDVTQLDDSARFQLKEAALRLATRTETPFEKAWSLAFEHPVTFAAIQALIDAGLWVKWAIAGARQTVAQLVALDGKIAENLLRRFLRLLSASGIVNEVEKETFELNTFSTALGADSDIIRQVIQMGTDTSLDSAKNLPSFLTKTKYQEPLDNELSNFADLKGEGFFAYCKNNPGAGKSFIDLMQGLASHKMAWTEVYDTTELFSQPHDPNSPVLVDIGGAHGLDISRFNKKHPDLPKGALILQDLPAVLEMAKLEPNISAEAYDFFEPQPFKGSRAYFMHAVPHDWPDHDCLRILANQVAAMKPGYSKLLIYEVVLPAKGASRMQTTLDVQLMSLVAAFERTEEMWETLLKQAGL